ncbi:MAG: ribosomal protein S18-alanine N-acetyltransferase [Halioglobus sp.]
MARLTTFCEPRVTGVTHATSQGMAICGSVRPAQPGDEAVLAEIDGLVNPSAWSETQFQGACDNEKTTAESALVVEQDNEVCGFIIFSQVLDEATIHNLAVYPQRHGQGLGRMLVDRAIQTMLQHGVRRCLLEVRESNEAARGLYGATGFHLDGERKNYYPTVTGREHALLMSREL